MNIEVFLTPFTVQDEDVRGRTAVVIDVLRSASTITAALNANARAVVPVTDTEEAGKIASNLDPSVYRLGGERNGTMIEGYHLGNSPCEYTQEQVADKTIILNTMNGTRTLAKAQNAEHLIVGSFLNASRVADFISRTDQDVVFICAGQNNRVSLEDILCVGLILDHLWEDQMPVHIPDAAYVAYTTYQRSKNRLEETLRNCSHAMKLVERGHAEDVNFCTRLDAVPVLPYYSERRITLHP